MSTLGRPQHLWPVCDSAERTQIYLAGKKKKKMQLEAELMTALTSIQPRSPLVIDKHRKQTRTTSSPGNRSPNKTNPPPPPPCGVRHPEPFRFWDSVATVTWVHHGDLHSWGRLHHLGLVQSPQWGTSDCAPFSACVYDELQRL